MDRLIEKSPRALYLLLSALDKLRPKSGEPLIAVAGAEARRTVGWTVREPGTRGQTRAEEIYGRIAGALRREQGRFKENGLSGEEKLEAGHFLAGSRLRELIQILPAAGVTDFIRENQYGVTALLSGWDSSRGAPEAAPFVLDPGEVHENDLVAVPFLVASLLTAAPLVRGVRDRAERIRLLEARIDGIVPGARPFGRGFVISLAEYVEQVLVKTHLLEASA